MLLALPPGFPRPLRRFINDCTNFIFLLLRGLVNIDWTAGCRCRVLTRWLLLIRPSPIEANAIQAFYTFRRELGLFKRLPLSVNPISQGGLFTVYITIAMFCLVPLKFTKAGVPQLNMVCSRRTYSLWFPAEADAIQAFVAFRCELGLSEHLPL